MYVCVCYWRFRVVAVVCDDKSIFRYFLIKLKNLQKMERMFWLEIDSR